MSDVDWSSFEVIEDTPSVAANSEGVNWDEFEVIDDGQEEAAAPVVAEDTPQEQVKFSGGSTMTLDPGMQTQAPAQPLGPAPEDSGGVIDTTADAGLSVGKGSVGLLGGIGGIIGDVGSTGGGEADPYWMAGEKQRLAELGLTVPGQGDAIRESAKRGKEWLTSLMSEAGQYSEKKVAAEIEALGEEGFFGQLFGSVGVYAENPRALLNGISESLPSMIPSTAAVRIAAGTMLAAKGLVPGSKAAIAYMSSKPVLSKLASAAALGEGTASGVSTYTGAREAGKDIDEAAGLGIGAGAGTALIGRVASKFLPDVEAELGRAMAGGKAAAGSVGKATGNIGRGMISEGALQELPQSMQEQVWANLAEDKPWDEGLGTAGGSGFIMGAGMGGLTQGGAELMSVPGGIADAAAANAPGATPGQAGPVVPGTVARLDDGFGTVDDVTVVAEINENTVRIRRSDGTEQLAGRDLLTPIGPAPAPAPEPARADITEDPFSVSLAGQNAARQAEIDSIMGEMELPDTGTSNIEAQLAAVPTPPTFQVAPENRAATPQLGARARGTDGNPIGDTPEQRAVNERRRGSASAFAQAERDAETRRAADEADFEFQTLRERALGRVEQEQEKAPTTIREMAAKIRARKEAAVEAATEADTGVKAPANPAMAEALKAAQSKKELDGLTGTVRAAVGKRQAGFADINDNVEPDTRPQAGFGKDLPAMEDAPASEGSVPEFARPREGEKNVGQEEPAVDFSPTQSAPKTPEFRKWFGDSKVADEKGEPIVVYHGSETDFNRFDPERVGDPEKEGGFFFSPNETTAGGYGPTKAYYLSLKNPYVTNPLMWLDGDGIPTVDELKAQGHDGIIIEEDNTVQDPEWEFSSPVYIAFNPTDVKSADQNNGDFDPTNPDVDFSPTQKEDALSGQPVFAPTQGAKVKPDIAGEGREGVIVGARPGEAGWRVDRPDVTPPPIAHPSARGPRVEKVGEAVAKIFKSKKFKDFIADALGIKDIDVYATLGSFQGKPEPSFVIHGEGMTFEQADALSRLLGVMFAQDAMFVTQPTVGAGDGVALYLSKGKRLTRAQIEAVRAASMEEGIDYTTSVDGTAFKFFPEDSNQLEAFYEKVAAVAAAADLGTPQQISVRTEYYEAESYISGPAGSAEREAWIQESTDGSPGLFGRAVDDILVPYARAVGAEGYRLSPDRFADQFGLTDKQREYVREALRAKRGVKLSTAGILKGEEKLDIVPSGKVVRGTPKTTVTDVMWALQNRAAQNGQIEPGDHSKQAARVVSDAIADEVANHITRPEGKSAIGWYDASLKKAKEIYSKVFPELLTDKDRSLLFDVLLGVTSQGNAVHDNARFAGRLYHLITREGMTLLEATAALKGSFGEQSPAIENNLRKFAALLETNGYDTMRELFNHTMTVGEWNAKLRTDANLYVNGKPLKMAGAARQVVTGWMVFGPKIGSFINNLHGDYSTLTADLWFTRTWNRMLGYLFQQTPATEAAKYQAFKDALIAEVTADPTPKKISKNGKKTFWMHGQDINHPRAPAELQFTEGELDALLADPEQMTALAEKLYSRFKTGEKFADGEKAGTGFSTKSDLRRAAKNWIEHRDDPVAAPRTDNERAFQQDVIEAAQKKIKRKTGMFISVADIQAALWYHEKELFDYLGAGDKKSAPADYADAAKVFAETYNAGELFHVNKKPMKGREHDYRKFTEDTGPDFSPTADAEGGADVRESAERPSYGTATEGSVSAEGTHYSREARTELDSAQYGSGRPGAERGRLSRPDADPAVKNRVFFYVDEGNGVDPEIGVGAVAHNVKLENLYPARQDPLGLRAKAAEKYPTDYDARANFFESEVVKAGFDGLYDFGAFGKQGVAVLLGNHKVPVAPGVAAGQAQRAPEKTSQEIQADALAASKLPGGRMRASAWLEKIAGTEFDTPANRAALEARGGDLLYRSDLAEVFTAETKPKRMSDEQTRNAKVDALRAKLGWPEGSISQTAPGDRLLVQAVRAVSRVLGIEVIFVDTPAAEHTFNGVVNPSDPKTLFLNVKGDAPMLSIIGHEFIHTLANTDRPRFAKVGSALLKANGVSKADIAAYKKWVNDQRAKLGQRPIDDVKAMEEMIADFSGTTWNNPDFWSSLADENPSVFKQVAQGFVNLINKLISGIKSNQSLQGSKYMRDAKATREILGKMLADMGEDVPAVGKPGDPDFLPAYHGTGGAVDKFSTDKIGTGEGNAAFGWGLYFASKREVGDFYRRKLAKKSGTEGNLYTVEIAPTTEELLKWDSSIANQPAKVRKVLESLGLSTFSVEENGSEVATYTDRRRAQRAYPNATIREVPPKNGGVAYRMLEREFGTPSAVTAARLEEMGLDPYGDLGGFNNDQLASMYLHSQGVRGVQFLDSSSRARGEGGTNYVVFNDADVEITAVNEAEVLDNIDEFTLPDFSPRQKPDPENTITAYKMFRAKGGKLYPLYISADEETPLGQWLDADIGDNEKSKIGKLALRPGWHMGDTPSATHIGGGRGEDGKPTFRKPDQVWAEVKVAADRDWQTEANKRARTYKSGPRKGEIVPSSAEIKGEIPEDGYYRYKTNPNMQGEWIIGGSIKIERILSDEEVAAINEEAGTADLPRQKPLDTEKLGLDVDFATQQGDTTVDPLDRVDGPLTVKTKFLTAIYDKYQGLIEAQQAVSEKYGALTEDQDVNLAVTVHPGRVRARLDEFKETFIEPLKVALKESGLDQKQIGEFLLARHAREANAVLKKRFPDRANNDRLSGMTDAAADAILARYRGNTQVQRLGTLIDSINTSRVNLMVREGLMTQGEAEAWAANYSHYVPLNREEAADSMPSSGRGFDVGRAKASKLRAGSTKAVDTENMVARVLSQYEATIARAEKNEVAKTFYNMAKNNPAENLWIADEVPSDPFLKADQTGSFRENRMAKNVITARIDGEVKYVTIDDSNPYGQKILDAMQNLEATEANILVSSLLKVNRVLAAINTSLSPEFVISNLIRDWQTAGFNLTDTELRDMKAKVLFSTGSAIKGIHNSLRGEDNSDWAGYFRRFEKAGAMTGWMQSYDSVGDRLNALQREIKYGDMQGVKQAKALMDTISDYNTIVENGVRLSAFRAAVDSGMSDKKAAALAKELTVNFNRRGTMSLALNALYLFAKASINGSGRILIATMNPKNKMLHKMMAATVVFAAVLEIVNRALDDDDEYALIPDSTKDRNLVFMDPFGIMDDGYFKIPLPWGYNVFHVLGQEIGKGIMAAAGENPSWSAGDAAARTALSVLHAFNPIQDGSLLQTLTPTIADPFARVAENKNWHGGSLFPDYNKHQADYKKYFRSAREESVELAKWMRDLTLDSETQQALIDVSPATLDMVYDFWTGSLGRVIADTVSLAKVAVTGDEIPEVRKLPMVRRIYGNVSDGDRQRQFYDRFDEMLYVNQALTDATRSEKADIMAGLGVRKDMLGVTKLTKKQLSRLSKHRRSAELAGDKEAVKKIEADRLDIMKRFTARYNKVVHGF